jgi:xylulokinase
MSAQGDVTVGIDIGTTSVKAVSVNGAGDVLARARVPHLMLSPVAGAFEHDIARAWQANVREALAHVATGLEVAAVNVSAMVPSLGALTSEGKPCSPGLLYGDYRGVTETNKPGDPGDAGELLTFLSWLTKNAPDAEHFWPAQAVANHALCGTGAIESIPAMSAFPLYNGRSWDEEKLTEVGVSPESLPTVVRGAQPIGVVQGDGVASGALVGGGTIDAFGEQIVAGADNDGDVLVICGATLITWAVAESDNASREGAGLWSIPHTATGKLLLGGPSNAGGIFVDRAHRWLGVSPTEPLEDMAPDDIPIWLPYVRGERTPIHRRNLRAELHNLAIHHETTHLRRAVYEASGFVVRHHLDLATRRGAEPKRLVVTGGGSRSQAWLQALADTTGLPVDVVNTPEGAALGSAFIARCVAGLEENILEARRWAKVSRRVEPQTRWREHTENRYQRFLHLTNEAVKGSNT